MAAPVPSPRRQTPDAGIAGVRERSFAGLGQLEELPAGDTLLTRRARAASKLSAVIVRWSQTRKRYERIGVLVEPAALAVARASMERDIGQ